MSYKFLNNTVLITKSYIDSYVKSGQVVLDATVGNGNDTALLAEKVGSNGKVYGFDIQEHAIQKTKDLLNRFNFLERVELIKDSHENIQKYIPCKLDFIIYNLGYLPGGNKSIITKASSTIKSIHESLELLNNNGLLLINSYIGHENGLKEKNAVENMLKSLNQKKFNVLKNTFINQKNHPPILYIVEKSSDL
ncbi:MAG: class I SAM-dependent methyltransferase [Tissierella sp.]|uniref:tRNA (mnm(5)s(2)U34)-methyltransferase n=1 Tax=Tissierella sp. TaxID=41274 RepID=UPI003F97F102